MSSYKEELDKARRLDVAQIICLVTILAGIGSLYVMPNAVESGLYANTMVIVIMMMILIYAIRRKKRNDVLDTYMEKLLAEMEALKQEKLKGK